MHRTTSIFHLPPQLAFLSDPILLMMQSVSSQRAIQVGHFSRFWRPRPVFYARYQTASVHEGPTEGIPPPLKGIKIVDLSRVLAGPVASMLLADLGGLLSSLQRGQLGHLPYAD